MPKSASGRGGRSPGGGGQQGLKVKVRTAKRRKLSSTLWLKRQLNDPYVAAAKREGYRSRAAYKLAEIDAKYRFLKPGGVVVDLGAAPGGWSQVAAARVKAGEGAGIVVAIDITPMDPIPGVAVLQADFMEETAPAALMAALAGRRPDCRDLGHGRARDRASPDRPSADHGPVRGCARFRARGAGARRRLPLQGSARRHGA